MAFQYEIDTAKGKNVGCQTMHPSADLDVEAGVFRDVEDIAAGETNLAVLWQGTGIQPGGGPWSSGRWSWSLHTSR